MAFKSSTAALFTCLVIPAAADDIVIPPPTVSCIPPLLWHTTRCECWDGSLPAFTSYGTPLCPQQPPRPAEMCVITIKHPIGSPAAPILTRDPSPACDDAALELAIALTLARRLGAP